jgi:hypothetical protein
MSDFEVFFQWLCAEEKQRRRLANLPTTPPKTRDTLELEAATLASVRLHAQERIPGLDFLDDLADVERDGDCGPCAGCRL